MEFRDYQDTIVIDLKDYKFENLDKKVRWSYKKAEKSGIIFSRTDLKELRDIHEIIIQHGEDNHYDSYSKDRLLKSLIQDIMFTAYFEGMIIGCLILSKIGEKEMKVDTCVANPRYKHLEIYTYLWVRAIEFAKTMNMDLLDLGGIYVDAHPSTKYYNITRFKERLGGKVVRKDLYYSNPLYVIGRKVVRYCKRKGYME